MSLLTDLQAAVDSVEVDAALFHSITQGDDTTIVTTEGGPVWSLAKSVKYIKDTGDAAIAAFNTSASTALSDFDTAQSSALVTFSENSGATLTQFGTDSAVAITAFNDAGASAITTFNAAAGVALSDLQDAIDSIVAGTDVALKSMNNTFTGTNIFNGPVQLSGGPGGVHTSANSWASDPTPFALDTTEYEIYARFTIPQTGADLWGFGFSNSPTEGSAANRAKFVADGGSLYFAGGNGTLFEGIMVAASGSIPEGQEIRASISRTGGVTTAYVNGVSVGTSSSAAFAPTGPFYYHLGALDSAIQAFDSTHYEYRVFNTVLTTDERAHVMRGETPVRLAGRAQSATNASTVVDNGFTAGGGTIYSNTTTSFEVGKASASTWTELPLAIVPSSPGPIRPLSVGGTITLVYDLTVVSGATPIATLSRGTGGVRFTGIGDIALTPGTRQRTVITENVGNSGDWFSLYTMLPGAGRFILSNVSLQYDGLVEHFAADQVTSYGRWIGKFGTSLIPGTGITPLDPQPVQDRTTRFVYDTATSTLLVAPLPGFSLSKVGTGSLWVSATPAFLATTAQQDLDWFGHAQSGNHRVASIWGPGYYFDVKTIDTNTAAEGVVHGTLRWQE